MIEPTLVIQLRDYAECMDSGVSASVMRLTASGVEQARGAREYLIAVNFRWAAGGANVPGFGIIYGDLWHAPPCMFQNLCCTLRRGLQGSNTRV
ncbi:hypothetical protein RvY_04246 [Ramazzottius varieornatus]|uniref:Uncharacterized protein n=1 Tax=Ramazzottius varieornatus TaxID=947166 RepID=A0A1D1V111_RAMVA|nr:hypothetical protein RvY_04246 [Ramazzottius varieornatus]